MDIRIVSFFNPNIPQEIVDLQHAVFAKFRIPIEQVRTYLTHGEAIDQYIMENKFDVIVIFDIDCIPLRSDTVDEAVKRVVEKACIYGAIQSSSHIHGSRDYISPGFISFGRATYELIGHPSFKETDRGDVGAELTYKAFENNVDVVFLNVASVCIPQWELSDGTAFGHGTNYADTVFHAFEIRFSAVSRELFEKQCREILDH